VTSLHPDKQAAILDAAQKRFTRYGLTKVTMDEIAADLGMSKAALYYYFPDKEDIFRRVITGEQQDFIRRMEVIVRGGEGPGEKLRQYFGQHLALLGSLIDLRILSPDAADSVKPIMRDLFRKFSAIDIGIVASILRQGKKRGAFSIASPDVTARVIRHVLQGLRIQFFKSLSGREPTKSDIRAYRGEVLHFLDILLKGISRQRNGAQRS
jgi:TetR/AcrR family transcriptional regulator